MRNGEVVAAAEIAATRGDRRRGLLGHRGFEGALVLRPCRQVHSVAMRFRIDVAFCDADGVVIRTATLRPWRLSAPCFRAAFAIEAPTPAFERWPLQVGDVVEVKE